MSKLTYISRFTLIGILLLSLMACSGSGVDVRVDFANTQDIEEGTTVYFDDQAVGEVSDVAKRGNGSLVHLTLDKDAAKLVKGNAAVVVNRLKEGAPLEIYNREGGEQTALQDGQEIKGFDSMFQLGAWLVGDAIKLGSNSVTDYITSFQDYLKGEQFQQDKAQVQEQINTATNAAQEALKTIEEDVNSAVEDMTTQEGEAAKVIDQLGEELSPLMEELAKSGSTLAAQLEQFTEGLKQTDDTQQQAGQTFLESMTAMLEQLNESMEQGLQEPLANEEPLADEEPSAAPSTSKEPSTDQPKATEN